MEFFRRCWSVVVPLFITIILSAYLQLSGYDKAAIMVSVGGTALSLYCGFAYVVFIDSKKRWPGLTWIQRLTKVVFFER